MQYIAVYFPCARTTFFAMAEERKELDWDLTISVPDKGINRKLRVTSNESISALILKIASKLGEQCCHE